MSERGSATTIDEAADLDPVEVESESEGESDVGSSDAERVVRVRRWGSVIKIAVAAALLAVSLSTAAVFGWKLHNARAVESAATAALDAARQYAVTLTSVSSDALDQNFAAVLDGATGEFKDMYSQSSEQLKQLLVDNKAAAQGVVIDAGVKSATTTEVQVLLFIDQTVSNTVAPDPRIDRSRVVMTMNLVDGRWLAGKVDLP
ncbi:hypothetical protein ACFRFQ_00205 [Rhodococcus sp. NPDC056743]|uniref:hypothetical protein n=1 Tax=Rhodococcus sp. NPDC056743 TaxID=3345934 RepID=UPI00366BD91D